MSSGYPEPPYPGGPVTPYGAPYGLVPREHPQGTVILVLGILGFFTGICGIVAWVMGNGALREIRESGVRYSNEQAIVTGRLLGKIVTLISVAGAVLAVVAMVVVFATAMGTSS